MRTAYPALRTPTPATSCIRRSAMTDHTPTPRRNAAIARAVDSTERERLERELAEANKKINANALAAIQVAEERDRAYCALADYKRLEAILEDRSDVKDGPEGRQLPNEAMSILLEWRGPV